jgi:hypothetical protein
VAGVKYCETSSFIDDAVKARTGVSAFAGLLLSAPREGDLLRPPLSIREVSWNCSITDKETVLNGARLRLASMIGGETVMVTQDLAHLAYHLKEELKDEEVYKLITALIVKMYSSLTSCRGPIVSEALKIASKEGLTAAEAAAILNSADDYHPNLTEAEVNIGVALCKHSVFTSVGNQDLRELFKLCWTDNPHVEGN